MLLIKSYNDNYRHQWDRFVMSTDTSSFFHLTGWKDVVEKVFGHKPHYIMAMCDDKIHGILPLFEIKSRLFGHALTSVPFGVYGGISAYNKEAFDMLSCSAETLARLIGVDYLELRQTDIPLKPSIPLPIGGEGKGEGDSDDSNNSHWQSKDLYVTFRRPILKTVDENFEAIPRKQRRMIRQGMKFGLESNIGGMESLDEFYHIYARNYRDLGTPVFPLSFLRLLMERFKDSFILSIWKDGRMVAGVLTFVFKDILMPYYSGGLREYYEFAINDFMYWELMKYGCEKGYRVFDFGRSKKDTGSYHFKRHWGFEPAALNYHFFLVKAKNLPNISPVNPKYRLFINVWKRLPCPVTNWLGPKLVKGIP